MSLPDAKPCPDAGGTATLHSHSTTDQSDQVEGTGFVIGCRADGLVIADYRHAFRGDSSRWIALYPRRVAA